MKKIPRLLMFCLVLALVMPGSARAHPADMYYHTHLVELSPDGILITWQMVPGPMIAQGIWFDADKDQDNLVSKKEAFEWGESFRDVISIDLNGDVLDLELAEVIWPEAVENLFAGEQPIQIMLQANWPKDIDGDLRLTLHNRFNPKNSLSWFEVRTAGDLKFETPIQNSGRLEFVFGLTGGTNSGTRLSGWESGSPSVPWVVESIGLGDLAAEAAAESEISPAAGSGPVSILEGLIKKQEGSFTFVLSALLLAALLGALHALSPGHGKTIVAAYLVGSQGKPYHAVALGGIVTLTHTGSVFALGILTLTASRYFLASDVFPILELASGLLIFVLGLGLLYPRLKLLWVESKKRRQVRKLEPGPDGGSSLAPQKLVIGQSIEEIGPAHSHDPASLGAMPRGPAQNQPLENIRWRNLIPLAISGGLVPCPDAIAILLIAAAINRIGFGLSLIVSFSLGLAVVLVIIGLLIVQGRRLFERLRWFNRAALIMPIFSALIVLGAGTWLTVSALRNVQEPDSWLAAPPSSTFELEQGRVLFTDLDENGRSRLNWIPAGGGEPEAISIGANIWYYAINPDQSSVIFAADNEDNGSRFWIWYPEDSQTEVLLECPQAYCSEIAWSPDGQGILYSKLEFDIETNPANVQSVWWLDLDTKESAPLFQDSLTPGFSARWSPDGKWISYTSINPMEIKIYNLETGESVNLPNVLGYPAIWSPDSSTVILQDLEWGADSYLTKLFSFQVDTEMLTMLAYGQTYDESYPAWSPDGEWLAVVRRAWEDGVPLEGNQVWVMRPDGTEARQYTDREKATFGQPVWSPGGDFLLFDFRIIDEGEIRSGVNILDLDKGRISELVTPGSRPAWIWIE